MGKYDFFIKEGNVLFWHDPDNGLSDGVYQVVADDTRYYDDLNMASHEEAKCMMEYLNKYRNV